MPGRDPGGMIMTILATILLGIGGALVEGGLGRMLEWSEKATFIWVGE